MGFYLSQVAFTPAVAAPPPPWIPSTFDWSEPSATWVKRAEGLAAFVADPSNVFNTSGASPLVILTLPAGTSQATFTTAVSNMTIDVIALDTATYQWHDVMIDVDRTARPLLICPSTGATVTFTGRPGLTEQGIFFFGYNSLTAWITMDGMTPDGFTFDGVKNACNGLFELRSSTHCTIRNFTSRNLERSHTIGDGPAPWKTWFFYISDTTAGTAGLRNHNHLLIENITMEAPVIYRDVSGFGYGQNTSSSNDSVTFRNISMTEYTYAIYINGANTNLLLDNWTIDDTGYTPDPSSVRATAKAINGIYKNLHGTGGSSPLHNQSTGVFVSGGGNTGL